jgi:hypothetical protein
MSSKKLRSRRHSVDSRAGGVQGNLEENSFTDFSQEGGIMTGEIRDSEIITSNRNFRNTNNDNAIKLYALKSATTKACLNKLTYHYFA